MSTAASTVEYAQSEGRDVVDVPEIKNYLLQAYATVDVFAETDAALTRYTQPSTTQYTKALVGKSLKCGEADDIYVLKAMFIEVLHEPVLHSMRSY